MKNCKPILSLVIVMSILSFCFVPALADNGSAYQAPEVLRDDGVWYIPENPAEVGFIFYCGTPVDHRVYCGILGGLANRGYFTASVQCPLDLAMLNPFGALQIMERNPDIKHWFIGGHSNGGVVAAMLASDLISRFEGVVFLASYSVNPISIPVLSIYGTNDGVLVMPLYQLCKPLCPNMTEIVIQGGNHAQFGNYGTQFLDRPADISMDTQQQICIDAIDQFIQANRKW